MAFGGINEGFIPVFRDEDRRRKTRPGFRRSDGKPSLSAALINALKIVGKRMEDIKVVVNGVGAAGVACSKIVMAAGVKNIVGCDQTGAIYEGRTENMNWVKDWYGHNTNLDKEQGTIHDVIKGARLPGSFGRVDRQRPKNWKR